MTFAGEEQAFQVNKAPQIDIRIHEAPTPDELYAHWERLFEHSDTVLTPFQTANFLDAFQKTVLPHRNGRVILAEARLEASAEALFLAPFTFWTRGPLRIASFADLGLADLAAPVFRAEQMSRVCFSEIWRNVLNALPHFDLLDIHRVAPTVSGAPNPLYDLPAMEPQSENIYLLSLLKDRNPRWRKRRIFKDTDAKFRALIGEGVELHFAETPGERLRLLHELVEQRKIRFDDLNRSNTLERPGVLAFYEELARSDDPQTAPIVISLSRGQETLAVLFALTAGHTINPILLSIGCDEWKRYSPGMVLMARLIDWAAEHDYHTFSFGTGDQPYKQRFCKEVTPVGRLLEAHSALGHMALTARHLRNRLHDLTD